MLMTARRPWLRVWFGSGPEWCCVQGQQLNRTPPWSGRSFLPVGRMLQGAPCTWGDGARMLWGAPCTWGRIYFWILLQLEGTLSWVLETGNG